jgi:mannose-6-phosphate isomerase
MPALPPDPLPFEPFLRSMPWGGERLARWLGRPAPAGTPIGEAWLVSDHPLHVSRVSAGPLAGRTLRELMARHSAELVGRPAGRFPLLVKLLDARENLSVQVHPDDADAARWAPGEGGKTEAWLVLDADPGATIYLGLKPGIDKTAFARELNAGTVPLCLRRYEPRPGECYFVPAGTVHALGSGLVVLEVQQTSDATFRLDDWGRVDAEGKPRALHLEAGLACLKEQPAGAGPQPPRPLHEGGEQLVDCPYFQLNRLAGAGTQEVRGPGILVGLEGAAVLRSPSGAMTLPRGAAVLLPVGCKGAVEPGGHAVLAHITWNAG